ncbi:LuxR C-terminal-related transcriptional regulator [Lentzea aerocolonigenes]|uniref:LuxR C-terminal-related transcriptional regulator n=1 Tax=Lentzea aerocolonigenes TaxID=68170 RepID=UPI000ABFCC0A|nr:LuxR C-terminal-related transcriptional regulator [Lentzea aerocolonigenes]MCP2242187.1 PAS fold-containing protein [Lentzea aerocolonigenes]
MKVATGLSEGWAAAAAADDAPPAHDTTSHPDAWVDLFRWLSGEPAVGVARLDSGMRITEANAEFLRQFRRTPGDLYGCPFLDLLHPGAGVRARRKFARLSDSRRPQMLDRMAAAGAAPGEPAFRCQVAAVPIRDVLERLVCAVVLVKPEHAGDGSVAHRISFGEVDARILEGIAAGESGAQLARSLHLSQQGVEYRVGAMIRRLGVHNRASLVSKAYSLGLMDLGAWPPRARRAQAG